MLYGGQGDPLNFHCHGFTAKSLRELLEAKGLVVKKIWVEKPYNIFAEATKVKGLTTIGDGQGREIERADVAALKPAKKKDEARATCPRRKKMRHGQ